MCLADGPPKRASLKQRLALSLRRGRISPRRTQQEKVRLVSVHVRRMRPMRVRPGSVHMRRMSAPWKHSSEKSASHTSKQSSTKKAIQKRRFSRSKSPDNALERTQHKKAKCGTSSCEGQREKDKDSERSRHAQFVKNQGTSQAPQVIMSECEYTMLQ